jgi:hypothetical protein
MTVAQASQPIKMPRLEFDVVDLVEAGKSWGCNSGPAALAACWCLSLNAVRRVLVGFEGGTNMTATQMHGALMALRLYVETEHSDGGYEQDIWPKFGICLVQFSGPWLTDDRPNLAAAAKHTHWIATKLDPDSGDRWVFDATAAAWLHVNNWFSEIVPQMVAAEKSRDGTYWLEHSWEIRKDGGNVSRKSI